MRVSENKETSQKAMAIFCRRVDESLSQGSANGDGNEGTDLRTTSEGSLGNWYDGVGAGRGGEGKKKVWMIWEYSDDASQHSEHRRRNSFQGERNKCDFGYIGFGVEHPVGDF